MGRRVLVDKAAAYLGVCGVRVRRDVLRVFGVFPGLAGGDWPIGCVGVGDWGRAALRWASISCCAAEGAVGRAALC